MSDQKSVPIVYSGVLLDCGHLGIAVQIRDNRQQLTNPGKLSLFGGRAFAGEPPRAAAARELLEETNLCVTENDLFLLAIIPYAVNEIMSIAHVYVAQQINPENIVLSEGAGYAIFPSSELTRHPKATKLCKVAAIIYDEMLRSNQQLGLDWLRQI